MEYFDRDELNKGRRIVLSIIIVVVTVEAALLLYRLAANPQEIGIGDFVSLGLVCLVAYLFFKGVKWMEFAMLLLFFPDFLAVIFGLLHRNGILDAVDGWFMLAVTVVSAVAAGFFLEKSTSLDAYMKYRRKSR
ncbi:hypothetical protein AB6A23_00705 [Paenibacillus tarimensis]